MEISHKYLLTIIVSLSVLTMIAQTKEPIDKKNIESEQFKDTSKTKGPKTNQVSFFEKISWDESISEGDPRKYIAVTEERSNSREVFLLSPRPKGNINQLINVDYRSKIKIIFNIEDIERRKEFKGFFSISAKSGDRNIEVNPYFVTGSQQSAIGISSKLTCEDVGKALSNILVTAYDIREDLNSFIEINGNLIYRDGVDKKKEMQDILEMEIQNSKSILYYELEKKSGASTIQYPTWSNTDKNYRDKSLAVSYTRDTTTRNWKFSISRYLLSIPSISTIYMEKSLKYKNLVQRPAENFLWAIKGISNVETRKKEGEAFDSAQITFNDLEYIDLFLKNLIKDDKLFVVIDKLYNLSEYVKDNSKRANENEYGTSNDQDNKWAYDDDIYRNRSYNPHDLAQEISAKEKETWNDRTLVHIRTNLAKLQLLLKNNEDNEINELLINTVFCNPIDPEKFMDGFFSRIDRAVKGLDQDNKMTSKEVKDEMVNLYELLRDLSSFKMAVTELVQNDTLLKKKLDLNDFWHQNEKAQFTGEKRRRYPPTSSSIESDITDLYKKSDNYLEENASIDSLRNVNDLLKRTNDSLSTTLLLKVKEASIIKELSSDQKFFQNLAEVIWQNLAKERFERLLTATIDLSKQDLGAGEYLNIYVNWENSDINKDSKEGGPLPLDLIKLKITKIGWFPEVSESFLLVKNLYADKLDPKTTKGNFKGQYGVNFFYTCLPDLNKRRYKIDYEENYTVGTGKDTILGIIERKHYHVINQVLQPSFGINLSYLDFSDDDAFELGAGLVIGLFRNKIHLTSGYNFFVDKNPFYVGIGFSFINFVNFFPKSNNNALELHK